MSPKIALGTNQRAFAFAWKPRGYIEEPLVGLAVQGAGFGFIIVDSGVIAQFIKSSTRVADTFCLKP